MTRTIVQALRAQAEALRAQAQALETLAAANESGTSPGDDWIDARRAPCSSRLFWAVARRREARGEHGVSINGRRCMMTRTALAEELERGSRGRRTPAPAAPAAGNVWAELDRALMVKGCGGRNG